MNKAINEKIFLNSQNKNYILRMIILICNKKKILQNTLIS